MYKRACPKCNTEQVYADRSGLNKAKKRNSLCPTCAQNKPNLITMRSRLMSKVMSGKSNPMTKSKHRNRLSESVRGKNNPMYGKHHKTYHRFDAWMRYKTEVRRITKEQPISSLPNYDKRGRCGINGAYQVDHKISILDGFMKQIPASIIGHINNLRMVTWEENSRKHSKSII